MISVFLQAQISSENAEGLGCYRYKTNVMGHHHSFRPRYSDIGSLISYGRGRAEEPFPTVFDSKLWKGQETLLGTYQTKRAGYRGIVVIDTSSTRLDTQAPGHVNII